MGIFSRNRKKAGDEPAKTTTGKRGGDKQPSLTTHAQHQRDIIKQTQVKFIILCMSVIILVLVISSLIVITVAAANRTQELYNEMYDDIRGIAIETPTLEITSPFSSSSNSTSSDGTTDSLRDAIEDALNSSGDSESIREALEALGIYGSIMGSTSSSQNITGNSNSSSDGNTSNDVEDGSLNTSNSGIGNTTNILNGERRDITTGTTNEEDDNSETVMSSLYELIAAVLLNSSDGTSGMTASSTISVSVYQFDEYHQAALLSGTAQLTASQISAILDAIDDGLIEEERLHRIDELNVYIVVAAVYGTSYFAVVPVSALDNYIDSFTSTLGNSGIIVILLLFVFVYAMSFQVIKPVKNAWDEQKRFIADASHELRTPVAVVMASAEAALADDEISDDTRKWLQAILAKSEDMSTLVNDLLSSVTLDTTSTNTKPETMPVDFVETVERIALQFQPLAFETGNIINTDIDENIRCGGATVVANKTEIERVVSILLDNAIKYSNDNTTINVELCYANKSTVGGGNKKRGGILARSATRKTTCVLRVTSIGDVVPPEEAGKIFDRFYRVDKSREVKRGSGIGLSLAKHIVDELHGSITCHPNDEETTFEVRLACTASSSEEKSSGTRNNVDAEKQDQQHNDDSEKQSENTGDDILDQVPTSLKSTSKNGEVLIG